MDIPTDTWIGLMIGSALLLFAAPPVARKLATLDRDPRIFRIVMWGAAFKLLAAPLYIFVIDHFYDGVADSRTYSAAGSRLATQFRHGDFSFNVGRIVGDGFVKIFTGFLYAGIGGNELAGFVCFAFLAFLGLALFYRAFRVALPNQPYLRYAVLLFFLPSLIFWTSTVGKDALVTFTLGVAALGGARVFADRRGGFPVAALGLGGTSLVRPHLALIMFAALAVAYPFRRARGASPLTPVARAVGIIVLVVGGLLLAKVTAHFFGLQSLSTNSVRHVLQQNAVNTGSAATNQVGQFASSQNTSTSLSPVALPKDVYYVLIRPLPPFAHGVTQLASSIENLFVAVLFIIWRRSVMQTLRSMWRSPYIMAAVVYSVTWVILFASVGNLGILARERTQLIPMLLVLLCASGPDGAPEPGGPTSGHRARRPARAAGSPRTA